MRPPSPAHARTWFGAFWCTGLLLLAGCTVRAPHYYESRGLTACVRHTFVTALGTVDNEAIIATGAATMDECLRALAR